MCHFIFIGKKVANVCPVINMLAIYQVASSKSSINYKTAMLSTLSTRNRGPYLNKCHTTNLLTNLFKVDFKEETNVYIYAAKTQPQIAHENIRKFRAILINSRKLIQRLIGTYATSGRTVFGTKKQQCGKNGELTFKVEYEGQSYSFILKLVKEVIMSDIYSSDTRKSAIVFSFLNNLMKNFFHQVDYSQIGRSRKYFDSKHFTHLKSSKIFVYKGYSSNFSLLEAGLFMRIDPAVKIVRDETALDVINRIYSVNASCTKQEKRLAVEIQMVGKMVMANYGKNTYYIVQSVMFDQTLESYTFFNGKQDINLLQYYHETYGIKIEAKRQPLLKAMVDRRFKEQGKEIVIIPELVLMSGLPDDFDQRKRREISQQTIVPPAQKLNEISAVFQNFDSKQQNFNPSLVADKLGIKFDSKTAKIQAKMLNIPELQLGRREKIDEHKSTAFVLFNKHLYSPDVEMKIAVICPKEFDLKVHKNLIESTCRNLGLCYEQVLFPIRFSDAKDALRNIEQIVEKQSFHRDGCNLFWFIIPNNFKGNYGSLKKVVLNAKIEKNSQITLTSTFQKKGFPSVMTKILLQMAAKVGNKLWVPRISHSVPVTGIMMVGIENYGDSSNPNKNILSFCCNTNRQCSSFYSNFIVHLKDETGKTHMNQIILQCLSEYIKCNNDTPTDLIIIKNGSTKYDNSTIVQSEINQIKGVLKSNQRKSMTKLVYILLDVNTNQKFFLERGKDIVNPQSGMLVNTQAVGGGFEFYMVAQQCNRGSVKPTFYKSIYCDSTLQQGLIEELLYSQCFNYMNWSGSIKVPSVVQYAKKLSMFVGLYLGGKCVGENMSKNLYYI